MLLCDFLFQAEDGIRDLVRSRGLGDVYKRQHFTNAPAMNEKTFITENKGDWSKGDIHFGFNISRAVSYTHLTLPTSDLV